MCYTKTFIITYGEILYLSFTNFFALALRHLSKITASSFIFGTIKIIDVLFIVSLSLGAYKCYTINVNHYLTLSLC